jgi:arginyl-tRNA synthetase
MVEFVSNPTDRCTSAMAGTRYWRVLANLLDAAGFDVYREYYINDAGRQMETSPQGCI